jgi:hypothetical protein
LLRELSAANFTIRPASVCKRSQLLFVLAECMVVCTAKCQNYFIPCVCAKALKLKYNKVEHNTREAKFSKALQIPEIFNNAFHMS